MITPLELYNQNIQQKHIKRDPFQAKVVEELQKIFNNLIIKKDFLTALGFKKKKPVTGLYLWGEVGGGKTYLMDLFYESLPFSEKTRMHFHHFMKNIHEQLKTLNNVKDPMKTVAKRLAKNARVLCFDEFYVSDIADAMLLARLLEFLFDEGVCLVATSNVPPDHLYWKGLQRSNFLPAIELLKNHTVVVRLENQVDYRLQHLHDAGVYYYPLDEKAHQNITQSFKHLAGLTAKPDTAITILNRSLCVRGLADDVIWFDFNAICNIPRSQLDFIEIAEHFSAVIVSDIPKLKPEDRESIKYLIDLVDVFYDANTTLIISAACPVEELYQEDGPLTFEFKRTQSRLIEMQSKDYLSRRRHGG